MYILLLNYVNVIILLHVLNLLNLNAMFNSMSVLCMQVGVLFSFRLVDSAFAGQGVSCRELD